MNTDEGNGYQLISVLFLRLLGIIYLVAFASLGVQIEGLAGSEGILPIAEKLAQLSSEPGLGKYLELPTLFWIDASDRALTGATVAGCLAAVLIIINLLPRSALIVAFVLYLSLYHASQPFLNFQWDGLLLEAGFLAIFLNPRSRIIIFLFRWLLFRLRFMSGLSKLTMQDPSWVGLTALNTYFEVQPLPTPLAWYAHQLPEWILKFGTAATLVIELLVPFMMFLPRRWRFAAAWITIFWQLLIIFTSNHNWINFLTILLCLFLFDDKALQRVLPKRLQTVFLQQSFPVAYSHPASRIAVAALAGFILLASAFHFRALVTLDRVSGYPGMLLKYAETYRVINKYHVFPTMKAKRYELELLGSVDGKEWINYRFKYKPGDPAQKPKVVLPHQPRLDWQMWFVTLHPIHMPWFHQFLLALLENSPAVTALLEENPFPDSPPQYIRVYAWRYQFTDFDEREKTGNWWKREYLGPFSPLPWVAQPRPGNSAPER